MLKIVVCFLIVLTLTGCALAFDDPPVLPAGFTAKATWAQTGPNVFAYNSTGYGTAYMNGPAGEFRITGTTQWNSGYVYNSDGLFLCGSSEQFYPSWVQTFPVQSPPPSHCSQVPFSTVVGACVAFGDGQLPKAGYLRSTTYYGQPSTAYVYPFLLGVGDLSSATFWFNKDATTLIGLQIVETTGWTTSANVTSMTPQTPPSSTFQTIPQACQ